MAIELQTFASGDTDYIAKLNNNYAEIADALNQLESQLGAIAGATPLSIGMFLDALFNQADALIGPSSYKPTLSGLTLIVSAGGMYLFEDHTTVSKNIDTTLSFIGKAPGTFYVSVDTSALPSVGTTSGAGTIYSVDWNGSILSNLVQIAPIFYDTREADRSRKSATLALMSPPEGPFETLDDRLEASETTALDGKASGEAALAGVIALEGYVSAARYRKIGCTIDGLVGVKGAIQIDFDGTIIGWSIVADMVGSVQVDVSLRASSAPPMPPNIPSVTSHKISGSSPIQLTGSQSAAVAEAGVASWATRNIAKWDVIQFNVVSIVTIQRATLYLRIQEVLPEPPVINPLSPPEEGM